jgi:hypothetical protein
MSFRQILNSPIFLVFMVTLAGTATVWCYIARQEGWNRMEKQQRIETDVKTSIEKNLKNFKFKPLSEPSQR